jgi:hypothetical protein
MLISSGSIIQSRSMRKNFSSEQAKSIGPASGLTSSSEGILKTIIKAARVANFFQHSSTPILHVFSVGAFLPHPEKITL